MRDIVTSVLEVVGAAMVTVAFAMVWFPAGLAIGGVAVIILASLAAR